MAPSPSLLTSAAVSNPSVVLYLIALAAPLGIGLAAMGFGRAKNAAHTMSLAFIVVPLTVLAFAAIGFGFMCGGADAALGLNRWLIRSHGWGILGGGAIFLIGVAAPAFSLLLVNMIRVAVAAAITIGATAERWRIDAFACFTLLAAALIYPVVGCWVWGRGWFAHWGGIDAGGSCAIHLQAGTIALVAALLLGPRAGKYDPRGRPRPLVGHHLPLALLGNGILALAIIALNLVGADVDQAPRALLNSLLAAAAGAVAAGLLTRRLYTRPDPSLVGNGLLAGLVSIAAGCAVEGPYAALFTGVVAGCLVVPSVLQLELLGLDDPVGAVSMHGIGGLWGTLAVGFFAGRHGQIGVQALGALATIAWAFIAGAVCFRIVSWIFGRNRVTAAVESAGLDVPQLGVAAYPEFLNPLTSTATPTHTPEPRPASLPTPTRGRHRYAIVIDSVDPATLIAAWSALCQARDATPPPQFAAVYPFVTTVSGTRFRFNGGDPAQVRANLAELLTAALGGKPVSTRLET